MRHSFMIYSKSTRKIGCLKLISGLIKIHCVEKTLKKQLKILLCACSQDAHNVQLRTFQLFEHRVFCPVRCASSRLKVMRIFIMNVTAVDFKKKKNEKIY